MFGSLLGKEYLCNRKQVSCLIMKQKYNKKLRYASKKDKNYQSFARRTKKTC